jgi:1,4-dihydroxy-2-naphthoate octaprenyltransferase
MQTPAPRRRASASAARVGYTVIRTLLLLAVAVAAIALSVLASVWGLSAPLVGVALVGLVVLRTIHRVRAEETPSTARPPQRAFVITAVVIIGFFVLLTLASQIWASH